MIYLPQQHKVLLVILLSKPVILWTLNFTPMKWFVDCIRRLSLHSFWSDLKIRWWTRGFGGRIRRRLLQRTVGNFNTKTTTHGKSTRNRALQKVSWSSLKIHSFDFRNGIYGNVASLEHRESIEWKLWPIFEWF